MTVMSWEFESPSLHISFAEIAQLVEHNLAKVRVASSSLVFRSRIRRNVVIKTMLRLFFVLRMNVLDVCLYAFNVLSVFLHELIEGISPKSGWICSI